MINLKFPLAVCAWALLQGVLSTVAFAQDDDNDVVYRGLIDSSSNSLVMPRGTDSFLGPIWEGSAPPDFTSTAIYNNELIASPRAATATLHL